MEEAEKQGRLQLQQALPHVVAAGNGKRQTTRSGSRAGSRRSGLVHYGRIDVVEVDRRKVIYRRQQELLEIIRKTLGRMLASQ